jgi:hypothetical protein
MHSSPSKWPLKKLGPVGPKALWERYKKGAPKVFLLSFNLPSIGLTLQLLNHLKEMDKHLQVRYLGLELGHKLALHSEQENHHFLRFLVKG